jgi:putative Mn2+ efflux pump MntP
MIGIISIVILALLGAVFVYFFVEIEEDGDDDNDDSSSIDSTENMASKVEESTEGWIWNEESNEWIEDPNY